MRRGTGKAIAMIVAVAVGVTYLNGKTGNHLPAPFKG
jgi:hypothetical protein